MGVIKSNFHSLKTKKMKNIDSIPAIVDGIFRDLNRASKITITLNPVSSHEISSDQESGIAYPGSRIPDPGSLIRSINGCQNPEEFYHALMSLCAGIRLSLFDAMEPLEPAEKATILIEALHRVNILLQKTITILLTNEEADLLAEGNRVVKRFKHARFILPQEISVLSHTEIRDILVAAHPFAHYYQLALRILNYQLICLLTGVEHPPDLNPPGENSSSGNREKLRFRGSVPRLAALGRIISQRKLFEIDNKSRFFRTVTGMFCTCQQPDISWLSYKNHFNNPSYEELLFWDTEITEWRRYIRRLMNMN